MLGLGSTSYVLSANAAKGFRIPVVRRLKKMRSNNDTSAKCKSVPRPHANLSVTPVDLTGAPK
jgi:hypothetical protein